MSLLGQVAKFADPSQSPFRVQSAAGFSILAFLLAFLSIVFQRETHLFVGPASHSSESYSRIWFTDQDLLAGATLDRGTLRITQGSHKWDLPIGAPAHWTVARNLSHAAWIEGTRLHTENLMDGNGSIIQLPAKLPRAVSVLPDGSAVVVFSDASAARWDLKSNRSLGDLRLPGLDTADRAIGLDTDIAIASDRVQTMALYRLRNGAWFSMESVPTPKPPFRLTIPEAGSVAASATYELRVGKQARTILKAVTSVVSMQGVVIVAGDFENVRVFGDRDYDVAVAPPHSVLAAGRNHLAIMGPKGISILPASVGGQFTLLGLFTASFAVLFFTLAGLLFATPLLFPILIKYLESQADKHDKPRRVGQIPEWLADPPTELAHLLASGRCALWAGAGLSAQSGVPDRRAMGASLLHTARVEGWIESSEFHRLKRRLKHHEMSEALAPLLEALSSSNFASHADGAIPHYVKPSPSHELLAKLPFSAAFTTNYDDLLTQIPTSWNATCLTACSENLHLAMDAPFLLKWYGNLKQFRTVLTTRPQLAAAAAESGASQLLHRVMRSHSLLFIGASLEGIKADLETLNVPRTRTRKHYVVAGVSDPGWKGIALELSAQYGIEALVCKELNIPSELPLFLEKLVAQPPGGARFSLPTPAAKSHTEPEPPLARK